MSSNSVERFICDNCGGEIEFNIARQEFCCNACGAVKDVKAENQQVQEYDFSQYRQREANSNIDNAQTRMIKCGGCGAEVYFDEHQTATTCPMCGSGHVTISSRINGISPEGIIPFRIDRYEADKKFKLWIRKRWFAPNNLKKSFAEGNLEGMYVPFWTYDAHVDANYIGRGGNTRTRTDKDGKQETYVVWTTVSGWVTETFDDIQVCASSNVSNVVQNILPFNTTENTKQFSHQYLSGYKAEKYGIDAEKGFEVAKDTMESTMRGHAESQIRSRGYDQASVSTVSCRYSNVKYKHVLLPIWSALYNYNSKQYRYMINGESGRVSANYPISWIKVGLLITVIATIILSIMFLSEDDEENVAYNIENVVVSQYQVAEIGEENLWHGLDKAKIL